MRSTVIRSSLLMVFALSSACGTTQASTHAMVVAGALCRMPSGKVVIAGAPPLTWNRVVWSSTPVSGAEPDPSGYGWDVPVDSEETSDADQSADGNQQNDQTSTPDNQMMPDNQTTPDNQNPPGDQMPPNDSTPADSGQNQTSDQGMDGSGSMMPTDDSSSSGNDGTDTSGEGLRAHPRVPPCSTTIYLRQPTRNRTPWPTR